MNSHNPYPFHITRDGEDINLNDSHDVSDGALQVLDAIEHFAKMSPAKIAEALMLDGIKGDMGEADSCPLAEYFNEMNVEADVNPLVLSFESDGWYTVNTPNSVSRFIMNFDAGDYPELENGSEV